MSIALCHDCGGFVDSDDDPDCFVEIGIRKDIIVCSLCRESRAEMLAERDADADYCIQQMEDHANA